MTTSDSTVALVHEAIAELEKEDGRVSSAVRKALRVARLRNDWNNVYWLQLELDSYFDKEARARRVREVAPYFSKEEFGTLHKQTVETSIASRSIAVFDEDGEVDDDKLTGLSVLEIEDAIERSEAIEDPLPTNLHPVDAYFLTRSREKRRSDERFNAGQLKTVLRRISQRVHTYLSQVERQLMLGQLETDIFEQNRRYVDARLRELCPAALEQLTSAYRRVREGTTEARSHALTSCRRALKSLADYLYAPRGEPVLGADGKMHPLTDAHFINRLWQFLVEAKTNIASEELLEGEISALGDKVETLNELASKGVHDRVSEFEVNLCVLNTYSVTGALLRLRDQSSAVAIDPNSLVS